MAIKEKNNVWYHVIYYDSFIKRNCTAAMSSQEAIDKHFGTRYRKSRYKVLEVIKHESKPKSLSSEQVKQIVAMADKTCHLANLERRLIKEAAVFLSDNLLAFPKKDLKFTQTNVKVWLKQYEELSKNF